MRKLTGKDAFATFIVAAIVVPFVGYSIRGSMPFLEDPRGMAAIGIVGGVIAFAAFGRNAFGTGVFEAVMVTLSVATLGVGIAALVAETSWVLLVPMVAGIVVMWGLALLHDAGHLAAREPVRHG